MSRKCALLLPQPGDVRIAEHGHAVGSERQHLFNRCLKCRRILIRQSVDQVHAQTFEAQLARCENQIACHFVRLDAADRLLHLRLKILNTHAQAIESEPPQRFQVRAAGDARVHLNTNFGVRREREPFARVAEKILHLRWRQKRRRTSSPVELDDRPLLRN